MHNCVTSHRGSSPPCTRHPIHACAPVRCVVVDFSSTVSVLYFVPPLSFQPFQMFSSVFNEKFRSNPLCDFRLGTVATSDHETPLTLSRCKLKSKGHGKLSIHFAANQVTLETIFRIIVFANQLSLFGAVANMCEEYEPFTIHRGNLMW